MSYTTQQFRTTSDAVGDWQGNEEEAARAWNRYVAPALAALYERGAAETGHDDGNAEQVQGLAWERFCDTTDDESWSELGQRVADYVRGN